MEQIDPSQIHLWLAWLGEITDARRLEEYWLLLSREEREKQTRFHFARDRHRYLVTRAMVRTVLSGYADVSAPDWRFAINPYGRPSVAPELGVASRIEFNVSHTDGLVVMGVTRDRAIGVDVEKVRAHEPNVEIAERYFAQEEVMELRRLPKEKQTQRFFEYWTLKESYIKARGMGLSIPLQRFAFHLEDPATIRLTVDPSLQDYAEGWRFWQLRPDHDLVAALCAENTEPKPARLTATRRWPHPAM